VDITIGVRKLEEADDANLKLGELGAHLIGELGLEAETGVEEVRRGTQSVVPVKEDDCNLKEEKKKNVVDDE
jgi:hypothetical protein